MAVNPKVVSDKIAAIINAWQTLRPTKSFAGLSLEQVKAGVQPSLDARTALAALQNQLIAVQDRRDDADLATRALLQLVVNGVKADPAEGDDGELYEAMGYVRKSARASGLHRNRQPTPPASATSTT